MRLDKFLVATGCCTRSVAKKQVRAGAVTVNGVAPKTSDVSVDELNDTVCYCGKTVLYRRFTYVMLNKPAGYVSATEDSRLPVVTELLSDQLKKIELFPVGRLDRDTVGLMILTNNGQLAHRVLSPKHHVQKEYRFKCAEALAPDAEKRFLGNITLADGYECKSAILIADDDRLGGIITLTEGKYHQIKRMIAATDNRVTYLERISFAGIPLDEGLARGEWRYLSESECSKLESF